MQDIQSEDVKKAMLAFLQERFNDKAEKIHKEISKATDADEINQLNQSLTELKQRYQLETWIENEAIVYAKGLRFGSHTSKGIHSSSKGDALFFAPNNPIDLEIAGSHNLQNPIIDASGSAAYFPVYGFFLIQINEDSILMDLILSNHPSLLNAFSDNPQKSQQFLQVFQEALTAKVTTAQPDGLNKQLLWPMHKNAISENNYHTLIPLHPNALAYEIYQRVNEIKFSEENKQARKAWQNDEPSDSPYLSISNLAYTKLGGTKPQTVSFYNNRQGGRQYLLPSLPPIFTNNRHAHLTKNAETFFTDRIFRQCYESINKLNNIIKILQKFNTDSLRNARDNALMNLIGEISLIASQLQALPVGWSDEHPHLKASEKYWLDPLNPHCIHRIPEHWVADISERFSLAMLEWFKKDFKTLAHDFSNPERIYFKSQFENILKEEARMRKAS